MVVRKVELLKIGKHFERLDLLDAVVEQVEGRDLTEVVRPTDVDQQKFSQQVELTAHRNFRRTAAFERRFLSKLKVVFGQLLYMAQAHELVQRAFEARHVRPVQVGAADGRETLLSV